MADLARRNSGLRNGDLHRPACAVAVFRSRGDVMGVSGRAISDQFGKWRCTARERMAQSFDDKHAGSFAHDEAVA
ncbi:hypothetical protein D3C72_2421860 [compost metagenome]